jgi:hypothetical protein
LNSVEIGEAPGIKYQLSFGTKHGLVEKLPERELNFNVLFSHIVCHIIKFYEPRKLSTASYPAA